MKKILITLCAVVTLSCSAFGQLTTAPSTYSSRATFESAAGDTFVESFDGAPTGQLASGTTDVTIAFRDFTVTVIPESDNVQVFTVPNGFSSEFGNTGTANPNFANEYIGWEGSSVGATFIFTFNAPITGFGFDFYDGDSTDSYDLVVDGFDTTNFGNGPTFFGIATGGESFTQVTFRQTAAGGVVDGFGFDNFTYTSSGFGDAPPDDGPQINPPTDIALTSASVGENLAAGSFVGTLSATDPDASESFTFSLVAGSGDSGNSAFSISGSTLVTAAPLDHEAQSSYSIRIRVTDSAANTYEEAFTISVLDDRTEDFDGDGLTEAEEEDIYGTSDIDTDSDGDGVADDVEVANGTDPADDASFPGSSPVSIPDAALEAALRDALSKPTGNLTEADLASLTSLDLTNLGITDLTGLEFATNLRILNLRGNPIIDETATFAILDALPLYCLYRDFPRSGGSNPGNLTEVVVSDTNGNPLYVVVDTNELETLDVSDGVIDVTDADNLIILQTLEDEGVAIETGAVNLPPAAAAQFTVLNAQTGEVELDGSPSADIDGTVVGYAWAWNGGSAAGVNPTVGLPADNTSVTLTVTDDAGATTDRVFTITFPTPREIAQQAYLKAGNTGASDEFGYSVAISGDTIVVGAYREDSNTTGVNGDQADNSAGDAGAAYVFVRDPSTGVLSQQAYLKASNTGAGDNFGWSVAVSGDTVVVGARNEDSNASGVNGDQSNNSATNAGAAYVFVRNGGTWSQQAYLKASNGQNFDSFGQSVAVSGETVVVTSQYTSASTQPGAAYVFVRSGSTWSQQAYLQAVNSEAGDLFGHSVAVSGDTLIVGAPEEGSNATGINGDRTNNSAFNSGAAYVFERNGSTWSEQAYLKASNSGAVDAFGFSVSISGNTAVVGAPGESSSAVGVNGDQADNSANLSGAAYMFVRNGSTWSQQAYLKASNTEAVDSFGWSVAVSSDTAVVGAMGEGSAATGVNGNQANNNASSSGAAYLFVREGSSWSQQAYLKASNTGGGDRFGEAVAVSGDTTVVGARFEDSNATGVNGDGANNSASNSSAAYVFAIADNYTVSFSLGTQGSRTGGGLLGQTIVAGNGATAPTVSANTGWIFDGWDEVFDNITSNLTVTAQYLADLDNTQPDQDVELAGDRTGGDSSDLSSTFEAASLTLEDGATFDLGPNETLDLNGGDLTIGEGAVFEGNGTILGNVINAGLMIIRIVKTEIVLPQISNGGFFAIEREERKAPLKVQAPVDNVGTFSTDGSLEITGTFTQTSTGTLRLFAEGEESGISYSQLTVGDNVTLDGEIQLVLDQAEYGLFALQPGDTFDLIVVNGAGKSITVQPGLNYNLLATQAIDSQLTDQGLTTSAYTPTQTNDPDTLVDLDDNLFIFELVENGTVIRATFQGKTPPTGDINITSLIPSIDTDPASDAWETANGFDPEVNDLLTLDSDGDGDPDIRELFQGTGKTAGGEKFGFQGTQADGASKTLSTQFRRSKETAATDEVEAVNQWSTDLVNWYESGESNGNVIVTFTELPTDMGTYEIVDVDVTVTTGQTPKLYYRLDLRAKE